MSYLNKNRFPKCPKTQISPDSHPFIDNRRKKLYNINADKNLTIKRQAKGQEWKARH